MTTLQVYMAAYSCEISIGIALLVGVAIGFWGGYAYGKDEGWIAGRDRGIEWGMWAAKQKKRNAKGQFTK